MKLTDLQRENRVMMAQAELFNTAEKEKGSALTTIEEWFVWTHPSMTFSEIREMLDKETEERQKLAEQVKTEKNLPDWPQFG